jgi:hypothetical protein
MKYFKYAILFIALFLGIGVQASVGGDTTIGSFRYNHSDESTYFVKYSDGGGIGCTPVINRMSLNSENVENIFSCDQGAELMMSGNYSLDTVTGLIEEMVSDYKKLSEINLKDNGFEIDIDYLRDEPWPGSDTLILGKHFNVSVYQNDRLVKNFEISGCSIDQPFIFSGYSVPGFNKRIMLLSSRKGDCFEGGYISEALYTIGQLDDISKEIYAYANKKKTPLIPDERSLVVYEKDEVVLVEEVEGVQGSGAQEMNTEIETEDNDIAQPKSDAQADEDKEGLKRGFDPDSGSEEIILTASIIVILLAVFGIMLVYKKSE